MLATATQLATGHDADLPAASPGRSTPRCAPRARPARWSAPRPATPPTTSGGRRPGSSRRCSRPGRRRATRSWAGSSSRSPRRACGPPPAATRSSTTCRRCAAGSSATSRSRQRDRELKLGAGGLRDVEFAVQLLQLVHGRTDPDLRLPGTLMGLRSLIRGGYVGRTDGAEMAAAYTFLRRAEHRLQLQRLRRTHLLPDDASDMEWLARTDGYTASGTATAAEVFSAERRPARRHRPAAAREAVLPAAAARGRRRRRRRRRAAAVPGERPAPGWPRSASVPRTPRCGTSAP